MNYRRRAVSVMLSVTLLISCTLFWAGSWEKVRVYGETNDLVTAVYESGRNTYYEGDVLYLPTQRENRNKAFEAVFYVAGIKSDEKTEDGKCSAAVTVVCRENIPIGNYVVKGMPVYDNKRGFGYVSKWIKLENVEIGGEKGTCLFGWLCHEGVLKKSELELLKSNGEGYIWKEIEYNANLPKYEWVLPSLLPRVNGKRFSGWEISEEKPVLKTENPLWRRMELTERTEEKKSKDDVEIDELISKAETKENIQELYSDASEIVSVTAKTADVIYAGGIIGYIDLYANYNNRQGTREQYIGRYEPVSDTFITKAVKADVSISTITFENGEYGKNLKGSPKQDDSFEIAWKNAQINSYIYRSDFFSEEDYNAETEYDAKITGSCEIDGKSFRFEKNVKIKPGKTYETKTAYEFIEPWLYLTDSYGKTNVMMSPVAIGTDLTTTVECYKNDEIYHNVKVFQTAHGKDVLHHANGVTGDEFNRSALSELPENLKLCMAGEKNRLDTLYGNTAYFMRPDSGLAYKDFEDSVCFNIWLVEDSGVIYCPAGNAYVASALSYSDENEKISEGWITFKCAVPTKLANSTMYSNSEPEFNIEEEDCSIELPLDREAYPYVVQVDVTDFEGRLDYIWMSQSGEHDDLLQRYECSFKGSVKSIEETKSDSETSEKEVSGDLDGKISDETIRGIKVVPSKLPGKAYVVITEEVLDNPVFGFDNKTLIYDEYATAELTIMAAEIPYHVIAKRPITLKLSRCCRKAEEKNDPVITVTDSRSAKGKLLTVQDITIEREITLTETGEVKRVRVNPGEYGFVDAESVYKKGEDGKYLTNGVMKDEVLLHEGMNNVWIKINGLSVHEERSTEVFEMNRAFCTVINVVPDEAEGGKAIDGKGDIDGRKDEKQLNSGEGSHDSVKAIYRNVFDNDDEDFKAAFTMEDEAAEALYYRTVNGSAVEHEWFIYQNDPEEERNIYDCLSYTTGGEELKEKKAMIFEEEKDFMRVDSSDSVRTIRKYNNFLLEQEEHQVGVFEFIWDTEIEYQGEIGIALINEDNPGRSIYFSSRKNAKSMADNGYSDFVSKTESGNYDEIEDSFAFVNYAGLSGMGYVIVKTPGRYSLEVTLPACNEASDKKPALWWRACMMNCENKSEADMLVKQRVSDLYHKDNSKYVYSTKGNSEIVVQNFAKPSDVISETKVTIVSGSTLFNKEEVKLFCRSTSGEETIYSPVYNTLVSLKDNAGDKQGGKESETLTPKEDGEKKETVAPKEDGEKKETVAPKKDGEKKETVAPKEDGEKKETVTPKEDGEKKETVAPENDDEEKKQVKSEDETDDTLEDKPFDDSSKQKEEGTIENPDKEQGNPGENREIPDVIQEKPNGIKENPLDDLLPETGGGTVPLYYTLGWFNICMGLLLLIINRGKSENN